MKLFFVNILVGVGIILGCHFGTLEQQNLYQVTTQYENDLTTISLKQAASIDEIEAYFTDEKIIEITLVEGIDTNHHTVIMPNQTYQVTVVKHLEESYEQKTMLKSAGSKAEAVQYFNDLQTKYDHMFDEIVDVRPVPKEGYMVTMQTIVTE